MNNERDKKIVEFFGDGECYHEPTGDGFIYMSNPPSARCFKCGNYFTRKTNPNFSTWEGLGWLWKKLRKDKLLWRDFSSSLGYGAGIEWVIGEQVIVDLLDSPEYFAAVFYNFIKKRGYKQCVKK